MSDKGNAILTHARQQFRDQRTVETLRKLEVPEWNNTTIYYWRARDVTERLAIDKHIVISGDRTVAQMVEFYAATVCQRARDERGNRLFSDSDEDGIRDTDPQVLQKIALAMGLGGDSPSVEEAEKN